MAPVFYRYAIVSFPCSQTLYWTDSHDVKLWPLISFLLLKSEDSVSLSSPEKDLRGPRIGFVTGNRLCHTAGLNLFSLHGK